MMNRELWARYLFRPATVIVNIERGERTVASVLFRDLRNLVFWAGTFLIDLVAAFLACMTIVIPLLVMLTGRASAAVLPGLLALALASSSVCFSAARVFDDERGYFLRFREAGTAFLKVSLGTVGCLSVSLVRTLAPMYYEFELRDSGFDDMTMVVALTLSLAVLWYLGRALFLIVCLLSPPLQFFDEVLPEGRQSGSQNAPVRSRKKRGLRKIRKFVG